MSPALKKIYKKKKRCFASSFFVLFYTVFADLADFAEVQFAGAEYWDGVYADYLFGHPEVGKAFFG